MATPLPLEHIHHVICVSSIHWLENESKHPIPSSISFPKPSITECCNANPIAQSSGHHSSDHELPPPQQPWPHHWLEMEPHQNNTSILTSLHSTNTKNSKKSHNKPYWSNIDQDPTMTRCMLTATPPAATNATSSPPPPLPIIAPPLQSSNLDALLTNFLVLLQQDTTTFKMMKLTTTSTTMKTTIQTTLQHTEMTRKKWFLTHQPLPPPS